MDMEVADTTVDEPVEWELRAAGEDLRIFVETGPLAESMLEDIRAARRRVWLESYIFADDAIGRPIADALIEQAKAGVDVRVMYDAAGSFDTPSEFWARLEDAGVRVHAFRELRRVFWRPGFLRLFNRRNHRKLLVVDDRAAYFGGMNLIDAGGAAAAATDDDARGRRRFLPSSSGWRDVHVRLAGPAQHQIAEAMERLWRRIHGRRERWPRWPVKRMLAARTDGVYFFESLPSLRFRRPSRVFCPLIRQAHTSITMAMAYFLPGGPVLRELIRARKRGVEVRVILPGASDVRAVQWAMRHMYRSFLRRGFRLYERGDRMLHGKLMVIDDAWTIVGSCNLDARSLLWNLEFLAVFRSRELAEVGSRIAEIEIAKGREVTLEDCRQRRWWQRWRDYLAWRLRNWL